MSHACCLTKAEIMSQTVTRMSSYITSDTARNSGNGDTARNSGNGGTAAYRTGGNGGPNFAYLSFMDLVRQRTNGNFVQQCPCVILPGSNRCITYDGRFQAATIEEAIITFVDTSMDPRIYDEWLGGPISGSSLTCSSEACRQCAALLAIRLQQVGLIQSPLEFPFSLPSPDQIRPDGCSRLRISRPVPAFAPPQPPDYIRTTVEAGLAHRERISPSSPLTQLNLAINQAVAEASAHRGRPLAEVFVFRQSNAAPFTPVSSISATSATQQQQQSPAIPSPGGATIPQQQQQQQGGQLIGPITPIGAPNQSPNLGNQGQNNQVATQIQQGQPSPGFSAGPMPPPTNFQNSQGNFPGGQENFQSGQSNFPGAQGNFQGGQGNFPNGQNGFDQNIGNENGFGQNIAAGQMGPGLGTAIGMGTQFGVGLGQNIANNFGGFGNAGGGNVGGSGGGNIGSGGFGTSGGSSGATGGGNTGGGGFGTSGGSSGATSGNSGGGGNIGGILGGGGGGGNNNNQQQGSGVGNIASGPIGGGFGGVGGFGGGGIPFGRKKRQAQNRNNILGQRFIISCVERGSAENEETFFLNLCTACWAWRQLPPDHFPRLVNELVCKEDDFCLSGWGSCQQSKFFSTSIL
uniref:Uncharacterized protein n=1 Tax=Acrobeloides nanus TaxID=290746 RepID=A0A914C4N6_9BILA